MTDAFIGRGTFKVGDGAAPEVFTAVEEYLNVTPPGVTNTVVDATNADSTIKEYIYGLSDTDEVELECNYLPAGTIQALLKTNVGAKTETNVQFVITDGTTTETYDFAVLPLSWRIGANVEEKNSITFTMRVTGAITES